MLSVTAGQKPRTSQDGAPMSLSSYGYIDIAGDAEIHFLRHVFAGTSVKVDVVQNGTGFEATRVVLLQS